MFMRLIHLINSTFLRLKIMVFIDWLMSGTKRQNRFLKSFKKRRQINLLCDANVPVRFRAQQRAKYSSPQLTANCFAATRCLRLFQTGLRVADKRGYKCPPPLTLLYVQNSNRMASMLTAIAKTVLNYSAFSLTFLDFAVQFCFRCKFIPREATLESSLTMVWFSWNNHNSLPRIATSEVASFCIDNRLRQMAFFVCAKAGKDRLPVVYLIHKQRANSELTHTHGKNSTNSIVHGLLVTWRLY